VLKAGAAYVPIDKDYPQSRKAFMLEDARPAVLIVESDSLLEAGDYGVKVFAIDLELEELLSGGAWTEGPVSGISPSNLAYVIYTSGSTGRPKGVMIEHRNLVNYILYGIDTYRPDPISACSFPLFTSLSFDLTQTSIYLTLLTGGSLYVIRENNPLDAIGSILKNERVNSIKLTPAHLSFLNNVDAWCLSQMIIGGEKLTASELSNINCYPEDKLLHLYNEYGPTETTIGCTVSEVSHYKKTGEPSIGRPIANTQVYIVDQEGNLVPVGVPGELYIGGRQVARGYLHRPELTAEKFVEDPFRPGERMYKTGDLGRWLSDGTIEFIGRRDEQVKIRGYRIELGEIEQVLSGVEGVRSCCVVAREDGAGSKRLVGYVVMEEGVQLDKEVFEAGLRAVLPDYMVPRLWVELVALPLTGNGKVDRKGLPAPELLGIGGSAYVAPRTQTEALLAEIWQDLLSVERVGIYDDFFELGGHSLLAMRLVSGIRNKFGIEIEIKIIFTLTTLELLGKYIATCLLQNLNQSSSVTEIEL
jgi:amino acid adenylation domain-containing protein